MHPETLRGAVKGAARAAKLVAMTWRCATCLALLSVATACKGPSWGRPGGQAHAPGATLVAPADPAATSRQWIARTQWVAAPMAASQGIRSNVTATVEVIEQTLGPALQDPTARLRASAAALRPVQLAGLGLMFLGFAVLAVPWLRAFVGSGTTTMALLGGGFAMALSPSLVPGRETLVGAAILVAIGLWWLAHRHGELRGRVSKRR